MLTFRKFWSQEEADDLIKLLEQHHIPFEIENSTAHFDPSFANNKVTQQIFLKIGSENFEKAEALLEEKTPEIRVVDIPKDHYLLSFDNDELMELLAKKDE